MIGFLIGTACLVGLIKTLRHGGCHGGFHGRSCHHGGGARGFGSRSALRFLFERLDTSPGQEKVILAAVEELWRMRSELKDELDKSRADVARVMRAPTFDEAALAAAHARQDVVLAKLRAVVTHALGEVHGVLDERQRKTLGDLLDARWGHGCTLHGFDFDGGPYRSPADR